MFFLHIDKEEMESHSLYLLLLLEFLYKKSLCLFVETEILYTTSTILLIIISALFKYTRWNKKYGQNLKVIQNSNTKQFCIKKLWSLLSNYMVPKVITHAFTIKLWKTLLRTGVLIILSLLRSYGVSIIHTLINSCNKLKWLMYKN